MSASQWESSIARLPKDAEFHEFVFSPEGDQGLVIEGAGRVCLHDTTTGDQRWCHEDRSRKVKASAFSSSDTVVVAYSDGSIRRLRAGNEVGASSFMRKDLAARNADFVHVIAMSPTGEATFHMGSRRRPEVTDASGRTLLTTSPEHVYGAFSPDGTHLVAADGTVATLFDLDHRRAIRQFRGRAYAVNALAADPARPVVAMGAGDGSVHLLDVRSGLEVLRLRATTAITSLGYSTNGRHLVAGTRRGDVRLWDATSGKQLARFADTGEVVSVAVSSDGRTVLTGDSDGNFGLWDVKSGLGRTEPRHEIMHVGVVNEGHPFDVDRGPVHVAASPDGRRFAVSRSDLMDQTPPRYLVDLYDLERGKTDRVRPIEASGFVTCVSFSPGTGRHLLIGDRNGGVQVSDTLSDQVGLRFHGHDGAITGCGWSPDGGEVVTTGEDGNVRRWSMTTGEPLHGARRVSSAVQAAAVSPDGNVIVASGKDGRNVLWDASTNEELITLVFLEDGAAAAIHDGNRFDIPSLEEATGLHWTMPDDPSTPLPLEIYMRDYYEPRLLARVLGKERFPQVRPLTALSRVQPRVTITKIERDPVTVGARARAARDTVTVTIEVEGEAPGTGRDDTPVTNATGAYDIRLFRDGQLVGQFPPLAPEPPSVTASRDEELGEWRRTHEVVADPGMRKATITFRGIRLPQRDGHRSFDFSAYAFNRDRVKSATARRLYARPSVPAARAGNAYVISVGVNAYESSGWDLRYAARDGHLFARVLEPLLASTGQWRRVVQVELISDWRSGAHGERVVTKKDATKRNVKAVLDILAGHDVDPALRASIPGADRLGTAQPDDLVLLAYSSHGYADARGIFYLFPYDIGSDAGQSIHPQLLGRAISSDELALWMADVDAGELVMVVDACHSAASVESTGFKPGPMGSRGLGQLAYDKGMRILASTRADDVAWEGAFTKHGLLSYALVRDGLVARRADFAPTDGKILVSEWLRYGVKRVPEIYGEALGGGAGTGRRGSLKVYRKSAVRDYVAEDETWPSAQRPSLFDFRRTRGTEPLIVVTPARTKPTRNR